MGEVTVSGIKYKIGRMSTFDQYHVSRKLVPSLVFMAAIEDRSQVTPDMFAKSILSTTSQLSAEDSEMALTLCLAVVERQDHGAWVRLQPPGGGRTLMFTDIGVLDLMTIVWYVLLEHGIPDFFVDRQSAAPAAAGSPAA